jgi:arginine repressor
MVEIAEQQTLLAKVKFGVFYRHTADNTAVFIVDRNPVGKNPHKCSAYTRAAVYSEGVKIRMVCKVYNSLFISCSLIIDSENIIIIKTLPGTAQAVASTIDHVKWPRIIGTVAGDDNIIVVVKPTEAVPEVLSKLEALVR